MIKKVLMKLLIGISGFSVICMSGCGHEKGTRRVYDYNKDGRDDTVTTWYDSIGNKIKEKIVLLFMGKTSPTTWVDRFNISGYKEERTFDNNSDGKLEGRITYDSTGGVTEFTRFDADGESRVYKSLTVEEMKSDPQCSNGIRDMHIIHGAKIWEEGVDCGGPCPPCSISSKNNTSVK